MQNCLTCDSHPCQCAELFNEIAGEEDYSLIAWYEVIKPHLADDPRARTDELEDFIEQIQDQTQKNRSSGNIDWGER